MHPKAKEALLRRLYELAQNSSPDSAEGVQSTTIVSSDGITFALLDEYAFGYRELIRGLLDKDRAWGEKFSERYIEAAIRPILAQLVATRDQGAAAERLDALVQELDGYAVEWVVYLPLIGVDVQVDQLVVADVVLERLTDARFDQLVQQVERINRSTKSTDENQEAALDLYRNSLDRLRNRTYARYQAVGESRRVLERAEQQATLVVDLLRYTSLAMGYDSRKTIIGIEGAVIHDARRVPIMSVDADYFALRSERTGSLVPFAITPRPSRSCIASVSSRWRG